MIRINLIYPRWYAVMYGSMRATKAWCLMRAMRDMCRQRGIPARAGYNY